MRIGLSEIEFSSVFSSSSFISLLSILPCHRHLDLFLYLTPSPLLTSSINRQFISHQPLSLSLPSRSSIHPVLIKVSRCQSHCTAFLPPLVCTTYLVIIIATSKTDSHRTSIQIQTFDILRILQSDTHACILCTVCLDCFSFVKKKEREKK